MLRECLPFHHQGWGEFSVGTAYTGTNPRKLTLKFSSVFYGKEKLAHSCHLFWWMECISFHGSRSNKSISHGKGNIILSKIVCY